MNEKLLIELLQRFCQYGEYYAIDTAKIDDPFFAEKSKQAIRDITQLTILVNFLNDGEFQFVKVENYQK